jgi:peptide/nickel transport system ATP-binding protein
VPLRGDRIGMVFQEPMTALNPLHTVGRQIAESLRLHRGLWRAAARAEALRLLQRVQLPQAAQRLDAYPHQLSGGQRQRVVIAIALACGPDLLIADEPTTALDVTIQREVLDLIDELVREDGMGLLLISHDLGVMADSVQQLMVMYAGTVVESGPTAEVFERLAHPYTRGLFAARPRLGLARGTRLATISGPRARTRRHARRAARLPTAARGCSTPAARRRRRCDVGPRALGPLPACHRAQGRRIRRAPLLQVTHLAKRYRLPRESLLQRRARGAGAGRRELHAAGRAQPGRGRRVGLGQEHAGAAGDGAGGAQRRPGAADGQDLHTLRSGRCAARARDFQMVFQDPYGSLDPRRTVLQTVAEPLAVLHGASAAEQRDARAEVLDAVGLRAADLAQVPARVLRRPAPAHRHCPRADHAARLIVADEPVSALDVSVQAQVLNLMQDLQDRFGVTYLFISHDLAVVDLVCDEVIVLQHGRIVEQGTPTQLFRHPQHPYTQRLLAAVPGLKPPPARP